MKKSLLILISCLTVLGGCAHSTMRGSVAMKVSDDEAHVCMGEGEVKAGDQVLLYKNVCTPKGSIRSGDGPSAGGCSKKLVGEGEIERVLNSHYSVMKTKAGSTFDEGTIVEKK